MPLPPHQLVRRIPRRVGFRNRPNRNRRRRLRRALKGAAYALLILTCSALVGLLVGTIAHLILNP